MKACGPCCGNNKNKTYAAEGSETDRKQPNQSQSTDNLTECKRLSGTNGKNGIMDIGFRIKTLRNIPLFSAIDGEDMKKAATDLEVISFGPNQNIITQGEEGSEFYILEKGECIVLVNIPGPDGSQTQKQVMDYQPGQSFGERALLRQEPRAATVQTKTECVLLKMSQSDFHQLIEERDLKEGLIRSAKLFETLQEDQVAKLAGLLHRQQYEKGDKIITQGEIGEHFFILQKGEAQASIMMADGKDQVVFTYEDGALFGEKALLEKSKRGASVTVTSQGGATVFSLSRIDFEANLGPLSQLHAEHYLSDPRKLISDFFQPGTKEGPLGSLRRRGILKQDETAVDKYPKEEISNWFSVYRPCSRDSIAKMLGRIGVGKGLDVKGKSAKKGRLSGFVPFLQISQEDHKRLLDENDPTGRFHVYYRNVDARTKARKALEACKNAMIDQGRNAGDDSEIKDIDKYAQKDCDPPHVWGLDIPEPVCREAYLIQHNISPLIGWETGRISEPEFMNLNLNAVRNGSKKDPASGHAVCLYQYDLTDTMNPWGLVIAYAEKLVKPVVSDFDTFTMGSTAPMKYTRIVDDQIELIDWLLKNTNFVLKERAEFWRVFIEDWKEQMGLNVSENAVPSILYPHLGQKDRARSDEDDKFMISPSISMGHLDRSGARSILKQSEQAEHLNVDDMIGATLQLSKRMVQVQEEDSNSNRLSDGWDKAPNGFLGMNSKNPSRNIAASIAAAGYAAALSEAVGENRHAVSAATGINPNDDIAKQQNLQNLLTEQDSNFEQLSQASKEVIRQHNQIAKRTASKLAAKNATRSVSKDLAISRGLADLNYAQVRHDCISISEDEPVMFENDNVNKIDSNVSGPNSTVATVQQGSTKNISKSAVSTGSKTFQLPDLPKYPWLTRWIDVLKEAHENDFHPTIPPYGFGDPTSVNVVRDVVKELEDCGAVRHGAECFNFYFPQVRRHYT